jgi:hypothetical protein
VKEQQQQQQQQQQWRHCQDVAKATHTVGIEVIFKIPIPRF